MQPYQIVRIVRKNIAKVESDWQTAPAQPPLDMRVWSGFVAFVLGDRAELKKRVDAVRISFTVDLLPEGGPWVHAGFSDLEKIEGAALALLLVLAIVTPPINYVARALSGSDGAAAAEAIMTKLQPPCSNCDSCGWVCESHRRRPWYGLDACDCAGTGMPCPVCNPSSNRDDPPRLLDGMTVTGGPSEIH